MGPGGVVPCGAPGRVVGRYTSAAPGGGAGYPNRWDRGRGSIRARAALAGGTLRRRAVASLGAGGNVRIVCGSFGSLGNAVRPAWRKGGEPRLLRLRRLARHDGLAAGAIPVRLGD